VGKIGEEQAGHIVDRDGIAANPADPETPSFMVNDQDNPDKLPKQSRPTPPGEN
jgi:hypothetical protein